MRGQIHNLVDALRRRKSPFELVHMAPLVVLEQRTKQPGLYKRILSFRQRNPWFTWC